MRPILSVGQRNRWRIVLTVLSGTLAAAATAGTGLATAAAAGETAREQAAAELVRARAAADAARAQHEALVQWASENPVVVTEPRPVRTVVGPKVVVHASSPGSARVGQKQASSSSSSKATRTTTSRPKPPPPPPPVKSTGS